MVNLSIFVERLKEYMVELELSETALASNIGCNFVTISGLINMAHVPSTETIIALTSYFNCSADYLLGLIEYPRITEFHPIKPFDDTLRRCLKESGKTEYRLQKDLNISPSLTYRWLHKKTLPRIDTLIKLKNYFGCSIDYLLGRES